MKKNRFFIGAIVIAIVIVFISAYFISNYSNNNKYDVEDKIVEQDNAQKDNYLSTVMGEVYAEPGEIINEKSFKVFQVWTNHAALVNGKTEGGGYYGITYLLVRDKYYYVNNSDQFYDEQIVKVPKGMVVRMFGTIKYTTRDGRIKTVPRIMIVDQ